MPIGTEAEEGESKGACEEESLDCSRVDKEDRWASNPLFPFEVDMSDVFRRVVAEETCGDGRAVTEERSDLRAVVVSMEEIALLFTPFMREEEGGAEMIRGDRGTKGQEDSYTCQRASKGVYYSWRPVGAFP